MGKKDKKKVIIPKEENEENILDEKPQEVKIKSKMYNNDFETELEKRDMKEETNEAIMWGFVIGFALFFILLIVIIVCTK